jgi:hypothetical protein
VPGQIIGIMNVLWHGSTWGFGLLPDNDRGAQDLGIYQLAADFQAILVFALIALALIRALAFWSWLRLVEEVVIPTAADRRSGETQKSCIRNTPMSEAARASSS